MPVGTIFQGHWRALEKKWLTEFLKLQNKKTVAVVTAGQPLSGQLMALIQGNTAGIRFFPGIPKLAEALSSRISGKRVPVSQSIALSWIAGSTPASSKATASFFEKLLEMGVSAEAFDTIAHSTKGLHPKVLETSTAFTNYSSLRDVLHPNAPNRIAVSVPEKCDRFQNYMFYGFYDLNPAQRSYIKLLSQRADITWFSPLHSSHHFYPPFKRTLDFLTSLDTREVTRVDLDVDLSSKAQFADNLLRGKKLGMCGSIDLLYSGSAAGFYRALTDRIEKLRSRYETSDIAVISTGEEAKFLVSQLYAANIPCSSPLTVKASSLPTGRFLERLLNLPDNRFHHRDIEKLLSTAVVSMQDTPDANQYADLAAKLGARFGLNALKATEFAFARILASFFELLPARNYPELYLSEIIQLLTELTNNSIPSQFNEILKPDSFIASRPVTFSVFKEMMNAALNTPVKLKELDRKGIAILSPEKARGVLKKAVIITGLEEGVFPRSATNDPRFPGEVRKQLQLSSPDTRETEEAFLFRQLFEAADEHISMICRCSDSSGRVVAVSPFIAPLDRKDSPLQPVRLSDSPASVLSIPESAPFLVSSIIAQRERLTFNPDDPASTAEHCGMIGPGLYSSSKLFATHLESYQRDPFEFLRERVWKIRRTEGFPVRSEPHYLTRGAIVHKCVEKVLKTKRPIASVVEDVCRESELASLLGSATLADIWMEHLVTGIGNLVLLLEEKSWTFVDSEKSLEGTIASYPAGGIIDLIFRNESGEYILADLKTGKPKSLSNKKGISIIANGLFQLPFYWNLAMQNGYTPQSCAAYIHIEGSGEITFKSLTNQDLESVNSEFEKKVVEIVESISHGNFKLDPEKSNRRYK